MSTDTPVESETTEPNIDFQVSDAGSNQYKQYRRLQAINDARKEVRDARTAAREALASNAVNEQMALATYRTRVEEYLFELRSIARKAGHTQLLEEEPLGRVVFQPPESLTRLQKSEDVTVLSSDRELDPKVMYFNGLDSILNAENPLSEKFKIVVKKRHHGRQPLSRTVRREIPFGVLDAARAALNDFAAMHGLDAEGENNREMVDFGKSTAEGSE